MYPRDTLTMLERLSMLPEDTIVESGKSVEELIEYVQSNFPMRGNKTNIQNMDESITIYPYYTEDVVIVYDIRRDNWYLVEVYGVEAIHFLPQQDVVIINGHKNIRILFLEERTIEKRTW